MSKVTIAELASRLCEELQRMSFVHEAGARAGDPEAIHDMRVATRRLRVALANFASCLPKDERREWRDQLNQLADALGRVRDFDVLIEAVSERRAMLAPERQAQLAPLISRLRRRRRDQLRRLEAYFDGNDYARLKERAAPNFFVQPSIAGETHGKSI